MADGIGGVYFLLGIHKQAYLYKLFLQRFKNKVFIVATSHVSSFSKWMGVLGLLSTFSLKSDNKNIQMMAKPRMMTAKESCFSKILLHKDYMVERSPLILNVLAIYCMLPTSWCCNPRQRQHSHHRSSKHRALVSVIPKVLLFSSVVEESILYFFNWLIREILDLIRKRILHWTPSAFSWLHL